MKMKDAVAARLDNLLKENAMSQYRLSVLSGIPQSTLSSLRNGQSDTVKLSTIYGICCGFNIEIADFFDDPIFLFANLTD